ncbi:MAG: HAD hydrolase-like protein [Planctomycetota bacterium]
MNALPDDKAGLIERAEAAGGMFRAGENGVRAIYGTADEAVDFVCRDGDTLACVRSKMGYPAIYPLRPTRIEPPVGAVLMDLDGTSVRSEDFWVWIIERTTARLLDDPAFTLAEDDAPHVSGHSVSEHLEHCIRKYCPDRTVEEARAIYFEITHREMDEILAGRGRADAFRPSPGLRDFLLALKGRGIRIGVVSSGLHEKAWPELVSAFRAMDLGDPAEFYDAIVTAGHAIRAGQAGTLGELEAKPHPWLYAEAARVGLGIEFADRHHVIGIEDSGAGVVAVRLAGFACIGMAGGNIDASGTRCLLHEYCEDFDRILQTIDGAL